MCGGLGGDGNHLNGENGVLIRRLDRQNLFNLLQEEVVPPEETEEDNESVLKKLLRKGGNAPHAKAE